MAPDRISGAEVTLRRLGERELDAAARVAARGMQDNPLNVAAIGRDPSRRARVLERLFARLLPLEGRQTWGAFDRDRLVGVASWARPGRCQPSFGDRRRLAPAVLRAGPAGLRMGRWFSTWARHDLAVPHSHLGPVAVEPAVQGRGVGSRLLAAYCADVDGHSLPSHLETDKAANVGFYERFGFTVGEQADVIGVPNWFMSRGADASGA